VSSPDYPQFLYLDLQSGISGDMAAGALLGLLADRESTTLEEQVNRLRRRLDLVDLGEYRLDCRTEERGGLRGVCFLVRADPSPPRSWSDIRLLLEGSRLEQGEKRVALEIFQGIAEAESRVHGVDPERVHFHEIGAVDSLVDVAGFAVLYHLAGAPPVLASPPALGSGTATSMHGVIPVPVPAVVELLRGVPVRGTGGEGELVTPTGAGILRAVARWYGPLPPAVIEHLGQSFGTRRPADRPNLLRVFSCARSPGEDTPPEDWVVVAEADIDDSTPEEVAYLQEELFRAGALDVFVAPVYMKKNRPAFHVTAVAAEGSFERVARTFLVESSTFGIRYTRCLRRRLDRKLHTVRTAFGDIRVKTGLYRGRAVKRVPEYEDCRDAARKAGVPFSLVYERARAAAEQAAAGGGSSYPPGARS